MHIRFDYVQINAICEKEYEIVACIINVWVKWKSHQTKTASTEEISLIDD